MTAIFGAGPHGREIAEVARALGCTVDFFDDDPDVLSSGPIGSAFKTGVPGAIWHVSWVAGAAWPSVRRKIVEQGERLGAATILVHPDATISSHLHEEGVVVAAGARLGINVAVGAHTHIGMNATVSRDCRIGSCVTLCPGVHVAGGVIVEDDVFVGIGACVAHELVVGAGALVGAGAVVVEDVAPGAVVVGNPARPR